MQIFIVLYFIYRTLYRMSAEGKVRVRVTVTDRVYSLLSSHGDYSGLL